MQITLLLLSGFLFSVLFGMVIIPRILVISHKKRLYDKNNNFRTFTIYIMMLNIGNFIADNVTHRAESMFAADIENNRETLSKEIEGKSLLVIGGAGSIGSSFIKSMLPFKPSKLVVVDLNENGLAELTRDLRST